MKKITDELKEIEEKYSIKILYACESGSRAWGFPSPNSDYDVRFIYVRSLESYLSVIEQDSQLTFPIDEMLDINGWDVKKTLQLIKKSNTTPFEWLQSPIIYKESKEFRNELWHLCSHYFNQRSNIFHYLGVAKGALDTIDEDNKIKIKKLFYVLRPVLAAQWCMERNEIAPMTIQRLMELLPEKLKTSVLELIDYKKTAEESYLISMDNELRNYIDNTFEKCSEYAKGLENNIFEEQYLNRFFINKVLGYS